MPILSLIMDVTIMLLLAATIYYAVKLSKHLDTFRSNRADMENLIRELSAQIMRAQEGISVLDELATSRGDELRTSIFKAGAITDELQLITESGNALAARLENLAMRSSAVTQGNDRAAQDQTQHARATRAKYEDTLKHKDAGDVIKSDEPAPKKAPFFAIRDPDFDDDEAAPPFFEEAGDDGYLSQAERELAQALQRTQPKRKS